MQHHVEISGLLSYCGALRMLLYPDSQTNTAILPLVSELTKLVWISTWHQYHTIPQLTLSHNNVTLAMLRGLQSRGVIHLAQIPIFPLCDIIFEGKNNLGHGGKSKMKQITMWVY